MMSAATIHPFWSLARFVTPTRRPSSGAKRSDPHDANVGGRRVEHEVEAHRKIDVPVLRTRRAPSARSADPSRARSVIDCTQTRRPRSRRSGQRTSEPCRSASMSVMYVPLADRDQPANRQRDCDREPRAGRKEGDLPRARRGCRSPRPLRRQRRPRCPQPASACCCAARATRAGRVATCVPTNVASVATTASRTASARPTRGGYLSRPAGRA